jgi:MFS family permease
MVLAALSLGLTESGASLVAAVSGLAGVLTGPWVGRWITRVGDRAAFVIGTALAVVSLAGALVTLAHPGVAWSQVLYVAAIAALSVSANIWSLARQSYVAESVPVSWRARGLSMLGGMLRMGQVFGPGIGSLALALWSYPGAFWLQIATTVVALGFVLAFVLPSPELLESAAEAPSSEAPSEAPAPPWRERADARATVLLAVGVILLTIVRANRAVIVPLWGHQLGISEHMISLTFSASAVLDAAVFYPVGKVTDVRGRRWALVPTMVIMGAGFIGLAMWQTTVGFVVCACLIGLGNGFGAGIVMTMGADLSPDVGRSRFLGLWQSVQQAGMTAGPFLVSALVQAFGVGVSAWATGALSLFGVAWFLATVPHAYARLGIDDRGRPLAR